MKKQKEQVKCIFQERSEPISVIASSVHYNDEVIRDQVRAHVSTDAYYIPKLQVLVVDQVCVVDNWRAFNLQWNLPDRRILETHETESAAIRRAVDLADEYYMDLQLTAVDDNRTDDQILTAHRDAHPDSGEEELAF